MALYLRECIIIPCSAASAQQCKHASMIPQQVRTSMRRLCPSIWQGVTLLLQHPSTASIYSIHLQHPSTASIYSVHLQHPSPASIYSLHDFAGQTSSLVKHLCWATTLLTQCRVCSEGVGDDSAKPDLAPSRLCSRSQLCSRSRLCSSSNIFAGHFRQCGSEPIQATLKRRWLSWRPRRCMDVSDISECLCVHLQVHIVSSVTV
jgi:hypothetical protein